MNGLCSVCGNLKEDPNQPYCSYCQQKELDQYQKVKNYVLEYPNSTAMEISNATRVPISKILKFIEQGAFIQSE